MSRKPDLVCIGAQKSGTSWLHEVLSERPDVWVPPFKELHFFDHKFDSDCSNWTEWHVRKGVQTAKSRYLMENSDPDPAYFRYLDSILEPPMFNGTWYKNVFSQAPKNAICLDTTPAYASISEEGIRFVEKFLKEAKLIYIIRSPFERALSQLRMEISRKGPPSTKEEWVKLATMPDLLSRGNYKRNIPLWSAHFDRSRLIFLPFQQIAKEPFSFLRQVERFAGMAPFKDYTKAKEKIHSSEKFWFPQHVVEIIKEETFEQDQFLTEHFGLEFLNQ